jgi:hypothetical protein
VQGTNRMDAEVVHATASFVFNWTGFCHVAEIAAFIFLVQYASAVQ